MRLGELLRDVDASAAKTCLVEVSPVTLTTNSARLTDPLTDAGARHARIGQGCSSKAVYSSAAAARRARKAKYTIGKVGKGLVGRRLIVSLLVLGRARN